MRQEIYQNGILIQVIDDGIENFIPDWRNFNLMTISNPEFKRICNNSTAIVEVQSLIAHFADVANGASPNYEFIQTAWKLVIDSLLIKPSQVEIEKLNLICSFHGIFFRFDSSGQIVL